MKKIDGLFLAFVAGLFLLTSALVSHESNTSPPVALKLGAVTPSMTNMANMAISADELVLARDGTDVILAISNEIATVPQYQTLTAALNASINRPMAKAILYDYFIEVLRAPRLKLAESSMTVETPTKLVSGLTADRATDSFMSFLLPSNNVNKNARPTTDKPVNLSITALQTTADFLCNNEVKVAIIGKTVSLLA